MVAGLPVAYVGKRKATEFSTVLSVLHTDFCHYYKVLLASSQTTGTMTAKRDDTDGAIWHALVCNK